MATARTREDRLSSFPLDRHIRWEREKAVGDLLHLDFIRAAIKVLQDFDGHTEKNLDWLEMAINANKELNNLNGRGRFKG